MPINTLLEKLQERYGKRLLKIYRKSPKRVYIDMDAKDVVDVVRYLFKEEGLRFVIASALDELEGLEILYHFALDTAGVVVSVRVLLADKANPAIDTITTVTPAAWWIEREIHELFGIGFRGNEDLRPLLLADDWPKGVYPLRKDFVAEKRDSRKT